MRPDHRTIRRWRDHGLSVGALCPPSDDAHKGMTRPPDRGKLRSMTRHWWIYLGLVGMASACTDGTPPAQQPQGVPPHPYVQPAQPAAALPAVRTVAPPATPGPAVAPKPPVAAAAPGPPPPATPYDTPATKPTAKPGPAVAATPYDPPSASPPAPPPPRPVTGADHPKGKPSGAPCSVAKECQSNVCEGQGCGYNAGRCAPKNRRCTRDLVGYCSCSGQTFGASGSCPGRIYRHQGVCKK